MARKERPEPTANDVVKIDGEVYDVARWAKNHPGGDLLRFFLGRDASTVFAAFHGPLARRALTWAVLAQVLVESARTTAMLFTILIGALIFANFVNFTSMPEDWNSIRPPASTR